MKSEKSPTVKTPKKRRILSSGSEQEEDTGRMQTEYEKQDPDYEPSVEKQSTEVDK